MGEDGSKLWLRYAPLGELAERYRGHVGRVDVQGRSITAQIIRDELTAALPSLLGDAISEGEAILLVGTPKTSERFAISAGMPISPRRGRKDFSSDRRVWETIARR
jgi:alpha-glucuronidase